MPKQRKSVEPTTPTETVPEKVWAPPLFGKQFDVFNCRKKVLLVCGSRLSGKTVAVLHRIVRHMWETPGASVAVFAKTIKAAKDEGVWIDLLNIVIPQWIEAHLVGKDGDEFDFTTMDANKIPGPKQDNQTRTAYFGIRNYYGGVSTCRLFSIEHEHEAATKVKGKRFSMIYFSELSEFKSKMVLSATLLQLRMFHLNPKEGEEDPYHQWIADTNPDEELGTNSWIYKVWYQERLDPKHPRPEFQKGLHLIEMFSADNPHLRRESIEELEGACAGEIGLSEAWVEGKWPKGTGAHKKHFTDVFSRDIHVIGAGPGENGQIAVNRNTDTLISGWDLGRSNHAAGIVDRWHRINEKAKEQLCFSILDEQVVLGEKMTLGNFALGFMDKMKTQELRCPKKPSWIHWTDESSINVWNPSSGTFDYQEILSASNGAIRMQGVPHAEGSVKARVRLVRKLLIEQRLFVAARCERIIAMFEHLQQGSTERQYVEWGEHKHSFDWLSYVLWMECQEELRADIQQKPSSEQPVEILSL